MLLAHRKNSRVTRSHRGFTLIEVLVTFVILSIGLLGIVSLQALSKTSQHQGIQRTRAVAIVDGLLEKIRINPAGLTIYAFGLTPLGGGTIVSEPSPDCISAVCSPTQMATHDLWVWEQALDGTSVTVDGGTATAGLIDPRACVTFTAAAGKTSTGLLQVLVQWSDLRETIDAVQSGDDVGVRCGGAAAGEDNFRRKVTASTFVIDEDEL
jgi:type IV pilus assembly protein PilV